MKDTQKLPKRTNTIPTLNKTKQNKDNKSTTNNSPGIKVGIVVEHVKFGAGTVVEIDTIKGRIKVEFSGEIKTFMFPDIFSQGYIRIK